MNKSRNISIQSELGFKESNITKVAGFSALLARLAKRINTSYSALLREVWQGLNPPIEITQQNRAQISHDDLVQCNA